MPAWTRCTSSSKAKAFSCSRAGRSQCGPAICWSHRTACLMASGTRARSVYSFWPSWRQDRCDEDRLVLCRPLDKEGTQDPHMTNFTEVWSKKSDEQVRDATTHIAEYSAAAQVAILSE